MSTEKHTELPFWGDLVNPDKSGAGTRCESNTKLVHEITNAGDTFGRGHNYFTILHAIAEQRLTALYRTIKQ